MNKRIEELAEQAGIEFDDSFTLEPEPIYYLKLSDFEKFAEMIVQECLNNMENCDGDLDFAIWKTKQDFGVKQ